MNSVHESGATTPVCHPVFTAPFSPDTPTLPAYDTGQQLAVWCWWCRDWHYHGGGIGGDDGSGHRWAHCFGVRAERSPYAKTGYFLKYAGPVTPEIRKDMKRRRPRGVEVRS